MGESVSFGHARRFFLFCRCIMPRACSTLTLTHKSKPECVNTYSDVSLMLCSLSDDYFVLK